MLASKARTYPTEAPLRYSHVYRLLALPTNIRLVFAGDKHSCILRAFVNYDRIKFYSIRARLVTLLVFLLVHSGKTLNSVSLDQGFCLAQGERKMSCLADSPPPKKKKNVAR